jgi:hypothetical protein
MYSAACEKSGEIRIMPTAQRYNREKVLKRNLESLADGFCNLQSAGVMLKFALEMVKYYS